MATTSASSRTLRTPELLEMILLQDVPLLQLFVLQRTCRAFNDTITASILLKRIMLLEPLPQFAGDKHERRELIGDDLNPILRNSKLQFRHAIDDSVFYHLVGDKPFARGLALDFLIASEDLLQSASAPATHACRTLTHGQHSWQKMLILQRPVPQGFHTRLRTCPRPVNSVYQCEVSWLSDFDPNATIGQLYAGLEIGHTKFLRAKKRGERFVNDYIMEHGAKTGDVMELIPESEAGNAKLLGASGRWSKAVGR